MRWRVFMVLLASVVLVADGLKRRPSSSALNKKSTASNAKIETEKPLAEEGGRRFYFQPKQRKWYGSSGIKMATVDARVIAESSGEGGFIIRPKVRVKSKKNKRGRTKVFQKRSPEDVQPFRERNKMGFTGSESRTTSDASIPPGMPLFSPDQWTNLFGTKAGMFLQQNAPGSSIPQAPNFSGYFRPQESSIYPQAPAQPFLQPNQQSYMAPHSSSQLSPYMGQSATWSFMPPGFPDGGAAGRLGYRSDGTYMDPGASMYRSAAGTGFQTGAGTRFQIRPGTGFQIRVGTGFQTGTGNFKGATGIYGPGAGMNGPGLGIYETQYRARPNYPYSTARGLYQGTPRTDTPYASLLTYLAVLFDRRGEREIYQEIYHNMIDIKWLNEVVGNHFTGIADITSSLYDKAVRCYAVINGLETSNGLNLDEHSSHLHCTSKETKAPTAKGPLRASRKLKWSVRPRPIKPERN